MLKAKTPLPAAAVNALYEWCLLKEPGPDRIHQWAPVLAMSTSMSMAFGELPGRTEGFEWYWVEEEENIGPALKPQGKNIAIWPIHMICRRLLLRQQRRT